MTANRIGPRAAFIMCAASVTALAMGMASAAFAQDTSADVGEVVVTASRIQSAGFTAPTPTTVLGAAELTRRAPASLLESINDIPSFRPSVTPSQSAASTGTINAAAGAAQVDLRGLGSSRTLLLINGRRTGGSQDLNQVPTALTQRVDVVTGGASAAWGSDAVAGVVNIILDTKFNGLRGNVQYGETKYGDDKTWQGSLVAGTNLFGDRAHLLIGGEYSDGQGVVTKNPITSDPRSWIADRRGPTITNPNSATNGLPPNLNVTGFNFSTMNAGGLITAGPLKGITFDNGGVPRQFQYGQVFGNNMIGGELTDPSTNYLKAAVERYSLFSHLDVTLSSKIKGWAELSSAQVKGQTNALNARDQANLTIQAANPFIPAAIKAEMTRLGLATLTMGRINADIGQPISKNVTDIYRVAAGLEGELGGSWGWDAYGQYGKADGSVEIANSRLQARWVQAIDAISGANGVPVCRNPADGCVPFNIFGPNAGSAAAIKWVTATQYNYSVREQTVLAANLHGEPISTWAGPVAVAAGAEYRKEKVDNTSDALSLARAFTVGNTQPLAGEYSVKEGYAEIAVPLLRDAPFGKALDLNGAIRYTDYTTSGGVTTWKIGATWEVNSELLFRATRSRDIRAPGLNELFSPGNTTNNQVLQIRGPTAGTSSLAAVTGGGNVNLRPERANTFTGGFTYRPKWARLRLSVDYFSINLKDQIATAGIDNITDRCRRGSQEFCDLITFNAVGTITAIRNPSVNNNQFKTTGIDFEASYSQPLAEISSGLAGTLSARLFATRLYDFAITDQFGTINRVGQNAPVLLGSTGMPDWVVNSTLAYDVGRFSGSIQWRWINKGVLEKTSIPGTSTARLNNELPSYSVFNLAGSYNFLNGDRRRLQLYGAINNLFNKGPPAPVALGNPGTTYDTIGTTFRAGLRFTY